MAELSKGQLLQRAYEAYKASLKQRGVLPLSFPIWKLRLEKQSQVEVAIETERRLAAKESGDVLEN